MFTGVTLGIIPVQMPTRGILGDVLPNAVQRFFVADDVFIVIPLPDGCTGRLAVFVDTACRKRFELPHDFR
jgi:hypothetical protein